MTTTMTTTNRNETNGGLVKNFVKGLFSSGAGTLLFIGGMVLSVLLLFYAGIYLHVEWIEECLGDMYAFTWMLQRGTFDIDILGMEAITRLSSFLMISMCIGYIPTFIYMFCNRKLEGGYGQKVNVKRLIGWMAIFYAANLVLEILINGLAPLPFFQAATADLAAVNLLGTQGNLWLNLLTTGILAPIAEEISLRYMVQKGMYKVNPTFAIIWASLIFGIMHMNLFQGSFAFIMGLILGIIYYKTGNLWYTTIIHIVNNSLAVLFTQFGVNGYVAYTIMPIVLLAAWYVMSKREEKKASLIESNEVKTLYV